VLCRIPDAGDRLFATIAVAVDIVPFLFVEVLQIVTKVGVVTTCEPFELVIVENTGFERVVVGCVVIVLVNEGTTVVTETMVEACSVVCSTEVSGAFDVVPFVGLGLKESEGE
jgi:hypothetical protein